MSQEIEVPELGSVGLLRYGWRQLTSMRTALILLLLLGIASIPGSLIPQRTQNPISVGEYFKNSPELAKWMDQLFLFDVYGSPWFSAIYILLFISLIGFLSVFFYIGLATFPFGGLTGLKSVSSFLCVHILEPIFKKSISY